MKHNEKPMEMLLHSAGAFAVLYVGMRYGLKQSNTMAQSRSLIAAALILIYMLVYGHKLPPFLSMK